jgi:hypothetical protein
MIRLSEVSPAPPLTVRDQKSGNPPRVSRSGSVVPVAVLTALGFDARKIDPPSVRFGRASVAEIHRAGHWEDVDGDGDVDLVLHFAVAQAGIVSDDTAVCLTGTLTSGERFHGCDRITFLP